MTNQCHGNTFFQDQLSSRFELPTILLENEAQFVLDFSIMGSSVGAVMRALAFHRCGLGSILGADVMFELKTKIWFYQTS